MQRLKADIRQRILEMGKKRFGIEGYAQTSMKDIACDVGISTGNIYRYFLTKGHLLDEILKELEIEIENYFKSIPEVYEERDLRQDYDGLVNLTIKIASENKDVLKIMFKSQSEKQFVSFKEHILSLFIKKIKIIATDIKKEKIDDILCESIARSLFEGFTYITKENIDDIERLKNNLEMYGALMLTDITKKGIEIRNE